MTTVLITGASRGIGLGLATAFAARGDEVIATCRNPSEAGQLEVLAQRFANVAIEQMDVTAFESVDAAAGRLSGVPIDILVNNAGITYRDTKLGSLNYAAWRAVMETNTLAPVKVLEAFLPHVQASGARKVANISSRLGSLTETEGGNYFYRTSKAALNMAMRSIAIDLAPSGISVVMISPGFVDTDFTRAVPNRQKLSVEQSADLCLAIIDRIGTENSGAFYRQSGEQIGW